MKRFGTQGEYHEGKPRVNPLFLAWAKVNSQEVGEDEIFHLYINNLPVSEGKSLETGLTAELHKVEADNPHMAVITLPANKGILSHGKIKQHGEMKPSTFEKSCNEIIKILTDVKHGEKNDFKLSDNIRKKIFGANNQNYAEIVNLLNKSFKKTLGYDVNLFKLNGGHIEVDQDVLNWVNPKPSEAHFQTAYFHFIKFELTNHIFEKLKPKNFNISCFDAIDRGGASSAYFNLIKSIELGQSLSKEEFLKALHAAPTMVKGRSMNHQVDMLWNAINAYVNQAPGRDVIIPEWLNEWRYVNAPSDSQEAKDPLYKLYQYRHAITHREADYKFNLLGMTSGYDKFIKRDVAEYLIKVIKFGSPLNQINENEVFYTSSRPPYVQIKLGDVLNDGKLKPIYLGLQSAGLIKVKARLHEIPKQPHHRSN